ncbi:MAG: hypothetical protein ACRDL7_00575, partial [Gaiellaceae bacterium]
VQDRPASANVKVSLSDYPSFSGFAKDWSIYERLFEATACAHNCEYIIATDEYVPASENEVRKYKMDNAFIYNALKKGFAKALNYDKIQKFKADQDGRSAWLAVKKWYTGQGVEGAVVQEAMRQLQFLKLRSSTFGGAETYITKFNEFLNVLSEHNKTMDESWIKSLFLMNIEDPVYETTKETIDETGDSLDEIQLKIQKKFMRLPFVRRPGAPMLRSRFNYIDTTFNDEEYVTTDDDTLFYQNTHALRASTNQRTPTRTRTPNFNDERPRFTTEQWITLPEDIKQVVRATHKYYTTKLKSIQVTDTGESPTNQLPHQYGGLSRKMNFSSTQDNNNDNNQLNDGETHQFVDCCDETADEEQHEDCPYLSRAYVMNRKENDTSKGQTSTRRMNVITVRKVSYNPRMLNTMFPHKGKMGVAILDGGCDTCLLGKGFKIMSRTERMVNIIGYDNKGDKEGILGSGITAVTIDGTTYLLLINEGVILDGNDNTLISPTQIQENGIFVDQKARRYGGTSCIIADEVEIPFVLRKALLTYNIREPTDDELEHCIRIELTSDQPWNPNDIDDDNKMNSVNDLKLDFDDLGEDFSDLGENVNKTLSWIEQLNVNVNYRQTTQTIPDYDVYREYLGWKSSDIIERTFQATTQLAKNYLRLPMRRHFKSRYPALNRSRLREEYFTDTWFASETAIGGFTCAQIYCGRKSKYIAMYPMTSESQGPSTLQDFIRDKGAPFSIKNDNSQMQLGKVWTEICRTYNIKQSTTEPKHPWQNKAERVIQDVKGLVNKIMDRRGVPNTFWMFCALYVTFLLNRIAREDLKWRTPIEAAFGETPDISALLQFKFFERVFYYDDVDPFPISKEKSGHFIGIAENVGDALTYWIYTEDTQQVIARSVLRSAADILNPNHRLNVRNTDENPVDVIHGWTLLISRHHAFNRMT